MQANTTIKCGSLLMALFLGAASQPAEAKRMRFRSSPTVVVVHSNSSAPSEQRREEAAKPKNPWAKDPAVSASDEPDRVTAQPAAAKHSRGGSLLVIVLAGILAVAGIGWHLLKSSLRDAAQRGVVSRPASTNG
jgi:hypothetical protein